MATGDITLDRVHRMGLDQYHRLIESGGFDEDTRIELIDGLLVDMSRKSREHELAVIWLNQFLIRALDPKHYRVGAGWPLTLEPQMSEPEPDVTVAHVDTPRPYHAATADLVVEVSVSSLRHDLVVKHRLYARAGVAEYWVVDIDDERVVRHREPTEHGYRRVDELRPGDTLVASSLDLPPLDVAELFEAAQA